MGAIENKETVRKIYAAMESGDQSAFAAAMDPDYVWRLAGQSSWSRRFEGREAVTARLLKPLFALFSERFRARAVNLVAEDDQVVAEVRGQVTTLRGERYDNQYCFLFRFRAGRICEVVEYCDTDLVERVLGDYDAAVAALAAGREPPLR